MQETIPRLSPQAPQEKKKMWKGQGKGKKRNFQNSTPYPNTSEKSQIPLLENVFPNGEVGILPPIGRLDRGSPDPEPRVRFHDSRK